MDQPQNDGDNDVQDISNDAPQSQDTPMTDTQSTDQPTQIPVSVQSADETEAEIDASVMDGVPGAGDMSSAVESAEEEVEEALPQTTDAELAAVASELESFANSDAMSEQNTQSSHDPMDQIVQEVNEQSTATEAPAQNQVADYDEPTSSEYSEQAEENTVTNQEDTTGENEVASMETENEYGSEQPPIESVPQESESESQVQETTDGASDSRIEQVAPIHPVQNVDESTESPEVIDTLQDEATMEQVTPEIASESAVHAETANEQIGGISESAEQTAAADSPETNEVVTPTAVAVAIAAGTAGDNAITGTPETNSVDQAQNTPADQNSKTPKMPKQKSGKGVIVLVVVLVTLLFGGGAVAAFMMQPEDEPTTNSSASDSSDSEDYTEATGETVTQDTATPGEKVEAKALDDYKAACSSGGLVSNATAYAGTAVHPLVVFEKGVDEKFAQSLVNFKDVTWLTSATKVTSGQLVACIARKSGSEVKLKDCPITDSVTKVTADVAFHSTKYTVDVYEALTGKKVTSFENSSISTTCPTNAVYTKSDPKIYAGFDQVALETSLKDSVTAKL